MFRFSVVLMLALACAPRPAIAQGPASFEHPHRLSVGVSGGYGTEQAFNDYVPARARLAIGELQLNAALITRGGKPVLEAVSSVVLGQSLRPGSRFIIGVSETFRFNSHPRHRFGTYVEAGAGEVSSALFTKIPETNGYFQYLLQGGTGVRWRSGRTTLMLGYRWVHYSNHGTTLPNDGLNLHAIVVSYAFTL